MSDQKATTDGARWVFDQRNATLALMLGSHCFYEIDLETCRNPGEVLDWICQVAGKARAYLSDQTLGELVRALHVLLRPQTTMCGLGLDHQAILPLKVLAQTAAWRAKYPDDEELTFDEVPPSTNSGPAA